MKHKICTLLLCLVTGIATAQTQSTFGAKGGINIAGTTFKDPSPFSDGDAKARLAFYLGVYANRPVNDKFSIQPELLFSSQGLRLADNGNRENWRNVMNYLNIPIMAQYKINDRFYAEAGPQIGILLSSTAKWKESDPGGIDGPGGGDISVIKLAVAGQDAPSRSITDRPVSAATGGSSQSSDSKSTYKTIDLGLGIGVGYELTSLITANVRYTQGLVNTFKHSTVNNKNTLFSLGIAYKLSKK
jgi:hypothetical protein